MTKDSTTAKTGHRIDGPRLKRNPWPREILELIPNGGKFCYSIVIMIILTLDNSFQDINCFEFCRCKKG